MKEIQKVSRKLKDRDVVIHNAAKLRDFTIVAKDEKTKGFNNVEYDVEVFNNKNFRNNADTIGITVYYPSKENPTHFLTHICPLSVKQKEFGKIVNKLYKKLLQKAGV